MNEFVGHYNTVALLESWICHFSKQTKKYVVIKGPHGIGKTMLVRILCKKYEIELHVADLEDDESFQRSMLNLCVDQGSILGKPRRVALLVDDIDAIQNSGVLVRTLLKRMKTSTVPLFCTCTTFEFEPSNRVQYVHMNKLSTISVYNHLQTVNQKRCFGRDDTAMKRIAKACNGDMRYALLSLEYCVRAETKDADRIQMPEALERIYDGECVDLKDLEMIYAKNGDKLLSTLHRGYLEKCDPRPRHRRRTARCILRPYKPTSSELTTGQLMRWNAGYPGPMSWPITDLQNIADIADGFAEQSIIALHNRDAKTCDLAAAIIAVTFMRFTHARHQRSPCTLPKRVSMQQTTLADMWASHKRMPMR